MTPAQKYRVKAAEFAELAMSASTLEKQTEYGAMASAYLRLAEQAEQNATNDIVYETPDQSESAP